MKSQFYVLFLALTLCFYLALNSINTTTDPEIDSLNKSGYAYAVNVSKINSKYSEIACATFRGKLVMVSSKKIGAFGNGKNPITNEPFTNLFCTDIKPDGELTYPMLFSRIINTNASEGQVAFSPDESTIYYTRSSRLNPSHYKLYKAFLEKDSYGNWVNETLLNVNQPNASIESPHVSSDGQFLYFSSNMPGGQGGFDLYKAKINLDGTITNAVNLGAKINTNKDEKYPHLSKDGSELFFSSKGHMSIGGFDIFISNTTQGVFNKPRNLGYTINSEKDDIGFIFIDDKRGVFSSNKNSTSGGFNLYRFKADPLYRELHGIVISHENKTIPNATVVLLNEQGKELERQITSRDASYSFKIRPYKDYQIKVLKDGFEDYLLKFQSKEDQLKTILKLSTKVSYHK